MGKVWLATILNFFFPGAGYLVAGHKAPLAVAWLAGVLALTYVEQGIKPLDIQLYWIMFGAVFVMNTAFAVDVYQIARAKLAGTPAAA